MMDLTVAILESISTGTFLYVIFVELIPNELRVKGLDAIAQLLLVIIGFGIMAGIQGIDSLGDLIYAKAN